MGLSRLLEPAGSSSSWGCARCQRVITLSALNRERVNRRKLLPRKGRSARQCVRQFPAVLSGLGRQTASESRDTETRLAKRVAA